MCLCNMLADSGLWSVGAVVAVRVGGQLCVLGSGVGGQLLTLDKTRRRSEGWGYGQTHPNRIRRRRAKIFGRCEVSTGIVPFGQLVQQVMEQEPYRNADRVFWIVDNGSSHRGAAAVERLQGAYPNLRLVHLPVHASWLNQVEIYFSVIQRKVLTPNDFSSLEEVRQRLLAFQTLYEQVAKPFEWKFTRAGLHELMNKLSQKPPLAMAA